MSASEMIGAETGDVDGDVAGHVLDAQRFPLWGSRLIEASAGTGKTWTIAALYLRLVLGHGEGSLDGISSTAFERPLMPPDILVMTFTRAATRELSDRIRKRLIEAVQCFRGEAEPAPHDAFLHALREAYPEGAARERAAWRLAMAAECMDDAAIHTIDAWCQRMLREHAFDSGNLFDETLEPDESQRQTEAAQDYWRQQCYPLSDELLDEVLKIWPHVGALVDDMRALLREPPVLGAGEGSLADCLQRAMEQRRSRLLALAAGWDDKAQRLQLWLDGQLDGHGALWDKRKLQPARYTGWLAALADWSRAPLDGPLALTEAARHRLSPEGLAEAFKGSAGDVLMPLELAELQALLVQLEQLPPVSVAVRLHAAARVAQRLAHLKRQAGSFGFADMLQRLDTALAGDNGAVLRERILAQYPVALIDEFQDTSPLQYRLFDQIYRTAANDPHSALLLIGDPKQSIYGFRGADIHSYLQARRATEGRHYVLGTNYRSTQALVGAVNHWFAQAEQRPGEGAFMFRRGSHNPLPFEPVAAQGRRELLHTRDGAMPALTVAWSAGRDEDTGIPCLCRPTRCGGASRPIAPSRSCSGWPTRRPALCSPMAALCACGLPTSPCWCARAERRPPCAESCRRAPWPRSTCRTRIRCSPATRPMTCCTGCAPSPRRWMPRPCARAWPRGSLACRWTSWPGWPPTRKPLTCAASSCANCTASGCAWACWPCCARPCTGWTCPCAGCRTRPWAASGA